MLNRVCLCGRITKEIELKKVNDNTVTTFSVAFNKSKDEACFFNCVAWNKTAELLEKYTSKGALIAIDGRLNQRKYTNAKKEEVSITEIIVDSVQFMEPKDKKEDAPTAPLPF